MTVLVTGAAGFVGRHVVTALASDGQAVRALVRKGSSTDALVGADCEPVVGDVTDLASLEAAAEGVDAVVHLVAILAGSRDDFQRVMIQGTANVVAAAKGAGVRRVVYMSALGTSEENRTAVPYFGAKWASEEAVRGSGLSHAILRPSFVFGRDGGALPRFVRIARLAPVTPIVGSGKQRLQPIWANDLAEAVVLAVKGESDALVELGGPDVVDWNEMWKEIKTALGTRRPAMHIPAALMRPAAAVLEHLPDPPVTRDQLTMLGLGDNVVSDGGASMTALGLDPQALTPLAEQLLRATEHYRSA